MLLGHGSIAMVMRYAHISDAHKRSEMTRVRSRLIVCQRAATPFTGVRAAAR